MTAPNYLTFARLCLLAPAIFVLIGIGSPACLDAAVVILLLSAVTDVLDGWLARKLDQCTDLGRSMDPIVDKVIICGALVMCLGLDAGLTTWMVAIVVAREFFVSGLRSYVESQGVKYGGFWWLGQQKIVTQYATVCAVCIYAAHLRGVAWASTLTQALIYIMLLSAIASGLLHIVNARRALAAAPTPPSTINH